MTVPTLVRLLQARGILLWLDGEQIRGRVLQGPLTRSDRALLTAHRTALLTWLRQQTAGEGAADCGTALPEPPCPPHIPYAPLPSDGPLRQCQTCPSVWYVTCPCGSIQAVACRGRDLVLPRLWGAVWGTVDGTAFQG
jgi:hypothetical protein